MNYTPLNINSILGATDHPQSQAISQNKTRSIKIFTMTAGIMFSALLVYVGFKTIERTYTKANTRIPYNITAKTVGPKVTSIEWSTDQETQAVITYGTSPEKMDHFLPEKQPSKIHIINFGGKDTDGLQISTNTTYYFTLKIGDKIYDNNGKPWTFTTAYISNPTTTPIIRPTQSIIVYIPPTIAPIPTMKIATCGSKDCVSICKKIGISCSSSDWIRSGCIGKVSLAGCVEILPTKIVTSTPMPTKSLGTNSQNGAVPSFTPTPFSAIPTVQSLKKPSDIETINPYASEHYKLYTDSTKQQADSYLQFFEAFRSYFSKNYFDISSIPVISVYLFSNANDYVNYSAGKQVESNYGYYQYTKHLIVTHSQAGLGTYAHELTHSFIDSGMSIYPGWFSEGLPTFFEKFIGYYDNQNIKIVLGFQNPWRVQGYVTGLALGTIQKPSLLTTARWSIMDNSETAHHIDRFLSLYLYKRGWLNTYINKLIQNPSQDENAEYITTVSGKTLSELEADYSTWLDQVMADALSAQSTLTFIPASFVLPNKTEWDKWVTIHRSELKLIGVNFEI